MSHVDTMTSLTTGCGSAPHANTQPSAALWSVPGMRRNGTAFTIWVDQNSAFWSITDGTTYRTLRGQGSLSMQQAMQQLGIID